MAKRKKKIAAKQEPQTVEKNGKIGIEPPPKPEIPTEEGKEAVLPEKIGVLPVEPPPKPPQIAEQQKNEDGRQGKIGEKEIAQAQKKLEEFRQGKQNLQKRVIENEEWWKLRHWEQMRAQSKQGNAVIDPTSAWLFNSVANKHADAMDNYPEPNILPREQNDKQDAQELSSILPVILEQNDYEQTYSETWWDKIKNGTGVKGVFWNPKKYNGLGDVEIAQIDLLNIFWEPGITDIQKSSDVFTVALVNSDVLLAQYPFLEGKLSSGMVTTEQYHYDDNVPTENKSEVVDWYYKRLNASGKELLHYCKFCCGEIIYASENTELKDSGFYNHGLYPFVFDTLFPEKGTPAGFGYIDVIKDAQMYIDKLDAVILENALQAGKPRYFSKQGVGVNEEEFTDWKKSIVHVTGGIDDSVKPIQTSDLPSIVPSIRQMKIDELKETSGNRDFSQGGTSSGVTAAAAIAALQEAGSKLSRDMIKSSYRSFQKECTLVVELIRQFYDEPRCFRITGASGAEDFTTYDNQNIKAQSVPGDFGGEEMSRIPVFDIKVKAQKSNPFNTAAQNEIMKELYQLQFFNPANADQALICLEGMTIEGKEMLMQKIEQNGTLLQQLQHAQQQIMMLTQFIDQRFGGNLTQQAAIQLGGMQPGTPGSTEGMNVNVNQLGAETAESTHTQNARQRTNDSTAPV